MKPSIALAQNRAAVRAALSGFRLVNPRVFGSVLHGTDHHDSDLDILIDPLPGATLLDIGGFQVALEELLGVSVEVLTPDDLPAHFREHVMAEAQPI